MPAEEVNPFHCREEEKEKANMVEITYSKVGDYLIPNLVLCEQPEGEISVWGKWQKNFPQEAQEDRLQSDTAEKNADEALDQYGQGNS